MRKYSFELIRTKDGSPERVSRFFPMMMSVRNGKATIENINLSVLNTLITDAERWALGQRQDREDRVREQRIRSEKESASEK
jgi:hypothetical protein